MSDNLKSLFFEIISGLLVLLFVYAATSKLIDHNEFVYSLRRSPLLAQYAIPISWLTPIAELMIVTFLFIRQSRQLGLLMSALLLSIFTFYIGYMLLFSSKLPCSCGGVIQQLSWRGHLVFNVVFAFLAFMAFTFSKKPKTFIAINRLEAENPVKKK